MAAIIDFLIRPLIGRNLYRISLPILGLVGVGGWLLFQWSYALGGLFALRVLGIAITVIAVILALWTVGRRMKDTGSLVLWLLGISVGGRLLQAGVRMFGGPRDQADTALGLVFVMVLLGLAFAPSQRAPTLDPDLDLDEDAEAKASL